MKDPLRFGDLFAGGGLASTGLMQAGMAPTFAIEVDHAAADCYERNHPSAQVIRGLVQDVDPRTLPTVDAIWASPPCPAFSQARNGSLPDRGDGWLALAVIPYLEVLRPRIFILENVPPFLTKGWPVLKQVVAALFRLGYMVDWQNYDAADAGTPQNRNRLILRAVRGSMLPAWPVPLLPWNGWYAAIEDLLPALPESAFAPWQVARLKDHPVYGSFLHMTRNTQIAHPTGTGILTPEEPANTVLQASTTARAFLVSGTDATVRGVSEPACTLTAALHEHTAMPRALLVHSTNMRTMPVREQGDPALTVLTTHNMPRALLIDGENARAVGPLSVRSGQEPAITVSTYSHRGFPRALLVGCQYSNGKDGLTVRTEEKPAHTIKAAEQGVRIRAGLEHGRVVSMTPRALARFQSVPDTFVLPEKRSDATRIIGNGVAVQVARRIAAGLISALEGS